MYKDLWLTSILNLVFLLLCIFGLRQWMGEARRTALSFNV
jgi:hypothetical protein